MTDPIPAGALSIPTADLYDAHHARLSVCTLQFRSFGGLSGFCGPAATLICHEDHRPVLARLEQPGEGRVLVVDAGGSLRVGVMGDRLAGIGARNGWSGVIINGAIRDSRGMAELPLGVKAMGTTARRSAGPGLSHADVPLGFGGMILGPGDWVYADEDCVIASPTALTGPEGE